MYESNTQAPLPRERFVKRMLWHAAIAFAGLALALGVGMLGYSTFERLTPLDAFLNSAMLLGGMGPVHLPVTPAGKVFAGVYALFSGLMFLVTAALVFTPIVHRVLHKFHWETDS